MKSLTLILGGIVIGAVLGAQGTIKALTSGADEVEQYYNRNSYMWHDDCGRPEAKFVKWHYGEVCNE